ncbi:GNAT family N-acetyltransferase [Mucilaginibacter jinjuensis]|uniref:GNAT family N-acetyltransferase n=1 Tax=Mucilaginibacter jinjuensis TaxID=1176721 RepID=A0ABY7TIP1_9SPHI|nr:GNAT family N-acetyltransferase [Mucilaginibacter jinjuensis]WCT15022.1 GNAT family N-acetyltransferase [Mucilaginibacter jinjuensis]
MDPINLKKVKPSEVQTLLNVSREMFFTAFAHLNTVDDMALYAAKAFTIEKLSEELSNPDSHFYFAILNENIAGYIKLNTHTAQTEFQDPQALEIERIYVGAKFQNQQIGKQLLQFAIDKAVENKCEYIWLGVWDANHNAIRFYKRHGFQIFSSHEFMLGNDKQTDLLMKKVLEENL